MQKFLTKPWLKALSGLFVNLSAAWFAAALITPNFAGLADGTGWFLTHDILFGILFLVLTVKLEALLEVL